MSNEKKKKRFTRKFSHANDWPSRFTFSGRETGQEIVMGNRSTGFIDPSTLFSAGEGYGAVMVWQVSMLIVSDPNAAAGWIKTVHQFSLSWPI